MLGISIQKSRQVDILINIARYTSGWCVKILVAYTPENLKTMQEAYK